VTGVQTCALPILTMEEREELDEEVELEEVEAAEELPLTFLDHLVIARSSLAAIAPRRPGEEEEEEPEESDDMEGAGPARGS